MKKRKIIPIFVPHIGCPHDCIFCNQKKITGLTTGMTAETAAEIIERHLGTIDPEKNDIEIAFFGGSFTAIETDFQRELLCVASKYKTNGQVNDIRLSTRPDAIDRERLDLLKEYGVTTVEIGVQSLDEDVLLKSARGHDAESVKAASALVKQYGFKLGLQMMTGLPSDSEQKCICTAMEFVSLKPDFVRIYPTLVVRDTGLERDYKSGLYEPFDIEKTLETVKKLLTIFYSSGVNVIRVGLQPTEEIALGSQVVAGPYHPAIREMVESRLYRDFIGCVADKGSSSKIRIYSAKRNISKIIGNRKGNLEYFKSIGIDVAVAEDSGMDEMVIRISKEDGNFDFSLDRIYRCLYDMYFRG